MAFGLFNETKAYGNISDTNGITAGVSWKGVDAYLDEINLNAKKIKNKLKDVKDMQTKMDAGWQGESKLEFYRDLEDVINRAIKQIDDETKDLEYRVKEIRDNFFAQDANMYKKG